MIRLLVVLAILAALSTAAVYWVLRELSDDSRKMGLDDEADDFEPIIPLGEYELWDRASNNRLATGSAHSLAITRRMLIRLYGNRAEDLVIGRIQDPAEVGG